jgi:osmotically inducible protein OsmC
MKRTASAVWDGTGKDGSGKLSTQSGTLNAVQYSYKSRFEEGTGTNPEELIAAAHAGCFLMKLSFVLAGAEYTPEHLEATATVTLEEGTIKSSKLVLKAKVTGISQEKLQQCAEEAKANCPVSKALNMDIGLEVSLV